jgi:Sulfatase-modifying factor enzyme 1
VPLKHDKLFESMTSFRALRAASGENPAPLPFLPTSKKKFCAWRRSWPPGHGNRSATRRFTCATQNPASYRRPRFDPLNHLAPKPDGAQCGRQVLRGGSWNNKPQNTRSANRNRNKPGNRNNNGFRVASTLGVQSRLGQG